MGDSKLEEGEEPISGGQLSVVNVSGVLVGEFTTDTNIEGHCFGEMESGGLQCKRRRTRRL